MSSRTCAGVVAQEIDRLAHLAERVRQRFAGLAHDQTHQRRRPRFQQIGGAQQARGALAPAASPARARLAAACASAASHCPSVGLDNVPTTSRWSAGIAHRRVPAPSAVASRARRASRCRALASNAGDERGQPLFVAKIQPGGVRRAAPTDVARQRRSSGAARRAARCAAATSTGSATSSSIGTRWSAMRFTNDVLAPFSSSRRTR